MNLHNNYIMIISQAVLHGATIVTFTVTHTWHINTTNIIYRLIVFTIPGSNLIVYTTYHGMVQRLSFTHSLKVKSTKRRIKEGSKLLVSIVVVFTSYLAWLKWLVFSAMQQEGGRWGSQAALPDQSKQVQVANRIHHTVAVFCSINPNC